MDITAIGIFLGLTACVSYALLRALRQRTFEVSATILAFLAGFAVPGGMSLIAAGVQGEPAALPTSWREYVAVAGIVAIGLAVQFLVQSFRAVWARKAAPDTSPSEVGESAGGTAA